MKRIIFIELKKAICNKWFVISVIVACLITLISSTEFIRYWIEEEKSSVLSSQINSPFVRSVAVNFGSLGATIFYFIFPILIAIPYSWSYANERKSGYEKIMIIKCSRLKYYISKYIVIFISGGLLIIIPLVFDFLVLSLFLPFTTPNSIDVIYIGVFRGMLFSEILYTSPFLYITLLFIVNFIFCGLLTCISYVASFFIKNRLLVTLIPFMFLLIFSYIQKVVYVIFPYLSDDINPMFILRGSFARISIATLIIEATLFFILTFGFVLIKGRKNEIY